MRATLIAVLATVRSSVHARAELELEILALRHQLAVLHQAAPKRPHFGQVDRLLWVLLSRVWTGWRRTVQIVQPATVVRWHRRAFALHWRWRSRRRRVGRPDVPLDIRRPQQMSRANPLWGAPRIHGELRKLGLEVSQTTVAKYVGRRHTPPSSTWRAFLTSHVSQLASIDFFTVPDHPTSAWTRQQIREAFPWVRAPQYLLRDRDAIYGSDFGHTLRGFGIEEVVSAPHAPWQNPFVERVIGSIQRECLDHVIVWNERSLRRTLQSYLDYYHRWRTHLSLDKDAPEPRPIQPPARGVVIERARVGALHHSYERRAA